VEEFVTLQKTPFLAQNRIFGSFRENTSQKPCFFPENFLYLYPNMTIIRKICLAKPLTGATNSNFSVFHLHLYPPPGAKKKNFFSPPPPPPI
jgi:hypothetical protein